MSERRRCKTCRRLKKLEEFPYTGPALPNKPRYRKHECRKCVSDYSYRYYARRRSALRDAKL